MAERTDAAETQADDENALIEGKGGKLRKAKPAHKLKQAPGEVDGPKGLEPTRYGDWEKKGLISDF